MVVDIDPFPVVAGPDIDMRGHMDDMRHVRHKTCKGLGAFYAIFRVQGAFDGVDHEVQGARVAIT